MKNLIVVLIMLFGLNLYGSFVDDTLNSANSLWDSTKKISKDAWETTKEYSTIGKNRAIEQTLLNGTNALVETKFIEIKSFKIDDKTNQIDIVIKLVGEDHDLNVIIDNFEWEVSDDKKYIVFSNIKISLDIPWLEYLLHDTIKRENGYYIIDNTATAFSLLYTIKSNLKTTYKSKEIKKLDFIYYKYDKQYFNITKFNIIGRNKIDFDAALAGSIKNLTFYIDNYSLYTANKKEFIVLKDIKFKNCSKPWIQSLIDNQDNQIYLDFTSKAYKILGGIEK